MVLNAARHVSGARTKIMVITGIGHVVDMVNADFCPMLACPYPDLRKNSMFRQERERLRRQIFDPKVLNQHELQPTTKQQQNLNMNNSRH